VSLFQSHLYFLHASKELTPTQKELITKLAATALESKDVPVGALLVYDDSIIGKGFNTVFRDNDVSGHAEINAINDAVASMGLDGFNRLDRDKLVLISSFEPCEMCKGTMLHYRIKHLYFMKDKSLVHWTRNHLKSLRYEWNKRKAHGEALQDTLFLLHPDYPGKKEK
jgi:tRNA(Arg) A34 adenosine deaminase TadA